MKKRPVLLLVDDTESMILLLESIFKSMPVETISARNGKTALKVLENTKVDLILLDIMMLGMDGYETCRQIKLMPQHQDVPIIFLTALYTKDEISKGFQLGAVDYVIKPFDNKELIHRVETHLALRLSRQELVEVNQKLNEANQKLSELNITKDRLLSIIAHDLRGPLSAFVNISELIHKEFQEMSQADIESSLEVMKRDSKRIFLLLENLLEWSRLQLEPTPATTGPVTVSVILEQALQLFSEPVHQKELVIENLISSDLVVEADSYMLQAILRNLISNAIKFSRPGGKIKIEAQNCGDTVELKVIDHGVGIPKEIQPRIFSLNHIYSTRGTSGERGSGLGLILCKDFLEKNSGSIRFESKAGSGTTFYITLPAVPSE
ncbi:MAG: hybrid sensor histidine kinase/response regulator [Candidatus Cloacimonetes bacterium]|nr:hybrid sensor histidine kinase/response regulator [Candidatus Cloacimonadota bacterium]